MSWAPEPDADGLRYYNRWAGSPRGIAEDPARCIVSVHGFGIAQSHQCDRKRGHGPGGLYCKQHDPAAVRARREASNAKYEREMDARLRPGRQLRAAREALEKIATGHNDARQLAADLLAKWGEL